MRKTILAASAALVIAFSIHAASALSGQPILMDGRGGGGGGGTTACDYGPNTTFPTGSLGTDLTTAGFTHCVLNADFTDNSGAHVASGGGSTNWVMNNPNTWLNQCAGTTAEWQLWFMWGNGSSGAADVGGAPCNRVSLPLDGATHALSFSYSNADTIADNTHQELILYWPDCGQYCVNNFNRSLALPNAKYYEVTFRLASNSLNQASRGIVLNIEDLISNGLNPGFHTAFMDPVFGEIGGQSPTSGGGTASWDNYVSGSKFTQGGTYTLDYTNYHTYAWLQTANGNNSTATASNNCMYIDGTAIPFGVSSGGFNENCAHWQNWTGAEILGHDMRQDVLIGTFCNTGSGEVCNGNTTNPLTNPITIFIKSIRVFTCSNYIGTNNDCGGTLVFHDITP